MFILLATILLQDVKPVRTIELQVPFAPREPQVLVDRGGHIWYGSYWDHTVYRLDGEGKEIYRISGPGQGPGEIEKPYCFNLVNHEKWLMVLHHDFILSLYDAQSGKFLKDLNRFYPVTRLYPWDDRFVLVLKSPRAVVSNGFELVDYRTGEVTKQWFRVDRPRTEVTASNFAFAQLADHTIYYQMGTLPEAYVVKPFVDDAKIWPLKPPPGYVAPPEKPMPEKDRFSRIKVDAFYHSFTKVKAFTILKEKYFLVCWEMPNEGPYYYQLYDLETQELKAAGLPLTGYPVRAWNGLIHTLERVDPDDMDTEPKEWLHAYEIDP